MKKRKAVCLGIVVSALVTVLVTSLAPERKTVETRIETDYGVDSDQFRRVMGVLLGPPLVPGNRVRELLNGVEMLPAMLDGIRGAQRSICFETYIYWPGSVGAEFADALSERARAGVPVRVMLDWVGANKMDEGQLAQMRDAGVDIAFYHPLRWYDLSRINHRTHRRILVIDGRVGFTGGAAVADVWAGDADTPEHWRDSQFEVEGPVVGQLQSAFMDNWLAVRGEALHDERYFPRLESAGDSLAQVFNSSPRSGSESVRLMFQFAIAAARRSIQISNSYFVPDDLTVAMLAAAARRGVRVQVIVPGPIMDVEIVRKASRARWGDLLEAGVEISEYQPTMFHCKVMIVDEQWVSVGSTNFDERSFRLNDETNLNVLDREFARRQAEIFERDLAQARQVTFDAWKDRPLREKLLEHTAALLRREL